MTEHDRQNLNFLMTVSEAGFKHWYDQADEDDIQYAFELIQQYRSELEEIEIENKLDNSDFSEVKSILGKFQL